MMPSEEDLEEIDSYTKSYMKRSGYIRYEFSNWCRPGFECRHNYGYWTGVSYLGFGLGASSFFSGYRWKNTDHIEDYLGIDLENDPEAFAERLRTDITKLSREEKMEEFMYLGLRCTEGVSAMNFLGRFGLSINAVFGVPIEKNIGLGLIELEGDRYRLTERGIDVSNQVLSEFLLH